MASNELAMKRAVLGLGGNLPSKYGACDQTVLQASKHIENSHEVTVISQSPLYKSKAWPADRGQPDFANMTLLIETSLDAANLLLAMQSIESDMGRVRLQRWGPRVIDIDLLSYGNLILPNASLWNSVEQSEDETYYIEEVTVPHPRLHKRAFAIIPFADIDPDWVHPILNKSAKELASILPEGEKQSIMLY